MDSILSHARECFFSAMLEGYAGRGIKVAVPGKPGFKRISFERGSMLVLDEYGPGIEPGTSFGTTTIFIEERLIWAMTYGGKYPKEVTPFLKEALAEAYGLRIFMGGRGPLHFKRGSLLYLNHVASDDFSNFRGFEEIRDVEQGAQLGFHGYWGFSLLGNPMTAL